MPFERAAFLDMATVDCDDLSPELLLATAKQWDFYDYTSSKEIADRIADSQVVVSNKVVIDGPAMEAAADLKLICVAATGTNNVDLAAARAAGIAVTNVTGYGTPSVVQHVFTLILALSMSFEDYRSAVARGDWQQAPAFCLLDYPIRELNGLVLGVVGYGELGRGVADLARAFGMEVLVAQRPGGSPADDRVALDELLIGSDVVSLHVPLAENTHNLIGARELELMKPDALLINTARGGIVDEQALVDALKQGRIGGAGFDVLTVEPPRNGNPLLAEDIPNFILTPHIAWASQASRQRLLNEVAANVAAFDVGEGRNRIV